MAVLISVTEGDVTQIVLADVGVQGAAGAASAVATSFTPYGNIAATNVQTAIQELDDEKFGKAGGTITGNLEIGTAGSLTFEGSTANAFETTLAVVDPTADRTVTLPDVTGTVVTTGDTGTVTSTMLLDGTILNADINASAGIVDTKLATIATAGKVSNSATTAASANTASAIVARDASGNFTAGTITAALTGNASTASAFQTARTITLSGDITATSSAWAGSSDLAISSSLSVDLAVLIRSLRESTAISINAAFSVGTPGSVPFGVGPVMPPSVAFAGIGADAYNPIHLNSGSFC